MKANEIDKIQDTIERLEIQVRRLEWALKDEKFEAELLYTRLANCSQYSKNYSEVFLAVHPRFPALLSRLYQLI